MSDFNATFAPRNDCVLLNTDGAFALCDPRQSCGQSLKRLNKGRRHRAKRTFTAGANCCSGHKNALRCR